MSAVILPYSRPSQFPAIVHTPIIDSRLDFEQAVLHSLDLHCPNSVVQGLALLDVMYYSSDWRLHKGQIVTPKVFENDIRSVFEIALSTRFPIHSVIPVSVFGWSDELSMSRNNSSGFQYRLIQDGTGRYSAHTVGAFDLNPIWNPEVRNGFVRPALGLYNPLRPGTLTTRSEVIVYLKSLGWTWGGDWRTDAHGNPLKDYMHLQPRLIVSATHF